MRGNMSESGRRISSYTWISEGSQSAHLYDGGLPHMLSHGGAIQDAVAVGGPLDVAQPAGPVRVAHQVGAERDGVIAGVACAQRCLAMRRRVTTNSKLASWRAGSRLHSCSQTARHAQREHFNAISGVQTMGIERVLPDLGYGGNSPLKYSLSSTWTKSTPADG